MPATGARFRPYLLVHRCISQGVHRAQWSCQSSGPPLTERQRTTLQAQQDYLATNDEGGDASLQ